MTTSSRRPSPAARAARRSRRTDPRTGTFLQRNRSRLLWIGGALVVALLLGMGYLSATRPAYACTQTFDPSPSPEWVAPSAAPVASGATAAPAVTPPPPGFVQPDMGHPHEVIVGATVRYTYCPPASGKHYNARNEGPILGGLHGPDDHAVPPGWIHNLEHGAIVLLYSCKAPEGQTAHACTPEGQQELEALLAKWPNSPRCNTPKGPLTPVIARFDDMPAKYTAVVWDVILPMETIDENLLFEFYARQAELYNPEPQCAEPTPTPAPATPTPSPTVAPTAAPSTAPSGSAAPASPAATTAPSPS